MTTNVERRQALRDGKPTLSPEMWLSRVGLGLTLIAIALRPLLRWHMFEPDEYEHLHASWAVAQGQVPYRDFFQNHTPLLYYLMAPVFTLMGEDLRIIYIGRGLMLLCILLIFLELYRIARDCFDALTGMLAVFLLSYFLLDFHNSYVFRPDIPQALVVLVGIRRFMRAWQRHSRTDFVVAGALFGVGYWVLAKVLFPLAGLTLVFLLSIAVRRSAVALRDNLTGLFLFLAAFAVPVVLGIALLWVAGALPNFLRWGVIQTFLYPVRFPALPRLRPAARLAFLLLALVGMGRAVSRMVKAKVVDEFQLSPLLACSATVVVFFFLMPAPNPSSALPFLPVAAMYGAEALRTVIVRALPTRNAGVAAPGEAVTALFRSPSRLAWAGLAALLVYGVCVPPLQAIVARMPPLTDQWPDRRDKIRYVLALTSPADSVFDAHGLYIFRPHATYYYRLGRGVIAWLASGLIHESEIMNDLRNSQCKVVIFSRRLLRLPPDLVRFLQSHYVSTHFDPEILVAGTVLHPADLVAKRATVSLIASAEYAVEMQGGTPRVSIDGRLYQAPLFLAQGDHQIVVEGDFQQITMIYSRALDSRFSPRAPLAVDHSDWTSRSRSQDDE